MVDAAKRGDERVLGMVADSGGYLGYSLVNLVNLFNPELLVVHGDMLRFGRVWSDSVARALTERMLPEVAQRLEIHPTGLPDDPVLTGAIAMVFDYIVNNPRLEYFVDRSSLARA
jgi:predicted NBD/HSP70 family sugar kinase